MKQLYLDNAATTAIDEKVLKVIDDFSRKYFANPSSQHTLGKEVREKLENARKELAKFIGAEANEIYFTSGGTESNNLALKGLALANPKKKHIITSKIEHPCILESCRILEEQGYNVDYLDVNSEGLVDLKDLEKKISDKTLVVSIMFVNNEIGVIQDVKKVAEICKKKNVYFHTDAVQAFGKLDIDVKKLGADLISVSGHKINAPKGIGFLYVKNGTGIKSLISGGGQERRLRSGTENVVGAIALAEAIKIKKDKGKIKRSRDKIITALQGMKGVNINGSLESRIYNNINVSFYGIEGESLMLLLDGDGIFVSTGSACNSTKLEESHVLKAIGIGETYINGSIRITLDVLTKEEEDFIISKINEHLERLRKISPFKI
ncbi:cysteine desulfurase [archaeon]|nr:cysteine desulfurase [archaeon]